MRETIANISLSAYSFLLPIAEISFLVAVLVLLPMAVLRRTRHIASVGLVVVSYVVGITTWLLGAGITFASFGWLGLFFGLLLFGMGVVFLGIAGAFIRLDQPDLAVSLLAMSITAIAAQFGGFYLLKKREQPIDQSLLPEDDVGNHRIVTWLRWAGVLPCAIVGGFAAFLHYWCRQQADLFDAGTQPGFLLLAALH